MAAVDYVNELRVRLANPAVNDSELLTYITAAARDVSPAYYSAQDYDAQILDTACMYLALDGKFPEVSSVSAGGVSTSFTSNDPKKWETRINARRFAAWMLKNRR